MKAFLAAQAPSLRSAFATTLACQIAIVVVMTLHLSNPAWAVVTILVLATPTAGASVQKGVLRLVGTVIGAGLALMLIEWFDQMPLAFSLSFFALCMAAAYGASGRQHSYAYLIGFVTVIIVAMEGLAQPDQAVNIAFARACEVGVGVATGVLVRLSVWPVRSTTRLRGELAASLEQGASLLHASGQGNADATVVALIRARQQQQTFLQAAEGESGLTRAQHRRHAHAVELLGAAVDAAVAAEGITSAAGGALPGDGRAAVAGAMAGLAQALRRRRVRGGAAIAHALQSLRTAVGAGAADGTTRSHAAALELALTRAAAELASLAQLSDYLGPGGPAAPAAIDAAAISPRTAVPRLALDRGRLLHAFKVALVVVSALWLWMVTHLPGGMQGMVSALIIAQHTVGATQLKGFQRLLGGLIGGALGILVASYAIPGVSSLAVFCLLTAPILFASAWLNDASPRYGYVGFQTGFTFALTLVAGPGPEPNTLAPVLRVCGILIGIGVASFIVRAVAPVDAWAESLRGLGCILASIARDLTGPAASAGAAERSALRDQVAAFIGELPARAHRRGWPQWPLERLLALESRLAALVGVLDGRAEVARDPELETAAAQLAAAARRLGADVAARRASRGAGEPAGARAALRRALHASGGAPPPPATLARAGALETAATLLAAIDRAVGAASTDQRTVVRDSTDP
jgi:uncharacterized membrane protein YccC